MSTSLRSSFGHRRPVALVRLLVGILLLLLVVGALGDDVLELQRFTFESPSMLWLHLHSTPVLDGPAVLLASPGGYPVIAPVGTVLTFVLWKRSFLSARFFVVVVLGAAVLKGITNFAFHRQGVELRPRRIQQSRVSFPAVTACTALQS